MRNHSVLAASAAVLAALSAAPVRAEAERWVFSTGADYTNGDYGETQDTTIVTVPFSVGYATERWNASLTVPFVSVQGPGTIVPGGFGETGLLAGLLGGASAASGSPLPGGVDESGLGDISLALSYTPLATAGGTRSSVTGRLRAPTADAGRGLGTGEGSAALAAGLRQAVGERNAIFATVGYEQAFESGGSGLIAGVGAERRVWDTVVAGATLDFSQASSQLRRDAAQAGGYLSFDVSNDTRLVAYGAAGLSETSPDVQAGLRFVFTPD